MFCPKCKTMLKPKEIDGRKVLVCPNCGYRSDSDAKIKEKKHKEEKRIKGVVYETDEMLPKTKAKCPKCGNDEAYFWEVQTRAADEPATKFLRCTKCKYTWRDYS